MSREARVATTWGLLLTAILAILIAVGSRNLEHFDAALVAYTFAVLFATFGITYRYAMWLQRPPTRLYWRRGWQAFFRRGYLLKNVVAWFRRVPQDVLANRFILARSKLRGITHLLIMWGCLLAVAITFPLVFGWLHFRPVPGDLDLYEAVVFGFPTFRFPHESLTAFLIFHGLVWASFLVIAGVMLAVRRRMPITMRVASSSRATWIRSSAASISASIWLSCTTWSIPAASSRSRAAASSAWVLAIHSPSVSSWRSAVTTMRRPSCCRTSSIAASRAASPSCLGTNPTTTVAIAASACP